jgi:hypothetical protein
MSPVLFVRALPALTVTHWLGNQCIAFLLRSGAAAVRSAAFQDVLRSHIRLTYGVELTGIRLSLQQSPTAPARCCSSRQQPTDILGVALAWPHVLQYPDTCTRLKHTVTPVECYQYMLVVTRMSGAFACVSPDEHHALLHPRHPCSHHNHHSTHKSHSHSHSPCRWPP